MGYRYKVAQDVLSSRVLTLEKEVAELKNYPGDKILDLELQNFSKSLKLEIQSNISEAHKSLEKKIDKQIKEAFDTHKEKISWGLELLRFAVMIFLFLISIKIIMP